MAKKGYGYFYFLDENGALQMRKLTGRKRKEVFKNYLRRRSGREMKLTTIAKAFNVSVRSMQKLLKELEQENVIRREATYDESGRQKANRIVYITVARKLELRSGLMPKNIAIWARLPIGNSI